MHMLVRGALRGGFVGVGFALAFGTLVLTTETHHPPLDEVLLVLVCLALTGSLVVGAAACVELVAARRNKTLGRDLVAALLALLAAVPLVFLAALEFGYTFGSLKHSGIQSGLEGVKAAWRGLEGEMLIILLCGCPPFGAITFARLREFRLHLEVAFVCGVTVATWAIHGVGARAPGETYLVYAALGLVLSLGTRAGDALARKIERRLSRDAEESDSPVARPGDPS
jgi:hypothetical protein